MDKDEEVVKKDISKRLRMSDKKKWNSLTEEERKLVADKYYDLRSIKHLGIEKILDDYTYLRRSVYLLIIGVLLGIIGSAVGDILNEYLLVNFLPKPITAFIGLGFFFYFVHLSEKLAAENLGNQDVLGHLLKLVKKNKQK